jgi:hypothetical protein
MLSLLTADDIFAHIVLLRTVNDKTIVIVEGDTDCAVLDPHLDLRSCESMPSGSKTSATGAAKIADEQGMERVVALVDRDWVGVLQESNDSPNVFYTDAYDMESTLLALAGIRERMLSAFADRDKLRRYTEEDSRHPLNVAHRASAALAGFRYSSTRNSWGIGVRKFPIETIMDLDGGESDIALLCKIAVLKNRSSQDPKDLVAEVESAYDWLKGRVDLHSGHDVMKALSYALNQRFNSSVTPESLASALRAATGCGDISAAGFFRELQGWATTSGRPLWRCAAIDG